MEKKHLDKKLENMREQNNKAFAREAVENWQKHVPVYGWMRVNYPSTFQMPLKEKYIEEKNKLKEEKDLEEKRKKEQEESEALARRAEGPKTFEAKAQKLREQKNQKNNRPNPETVNEIEMKEADKLVPINYSEKFLQNYEKNDFGFLKNRLKNFELNKKGFDLENNIPHNYTKVIIEGQNKYLYQLGIKTAATYLSTMDYDKKCEFINMKYLLDQKYCTMYPKSAMLGPKPDNNFDDKGKNLNNISFDENNDEIESVKNLRRLPPENITEEWVKENLNENVQKINFENCYWLTKDLISKLGRLDNKLLSCNIRNLDVSNYIVENILYHASNIKELNISNCTGLTNGVLEIISEKGKNIEVLNISNIPHAVNDIGLISIGENIKNLKDLNLSRNKDITDKGIKGLICGGLHFERMDISFCTKITDESLNLIWEYQNKYLKDFSFNCLPLITENGFGGLAKCQFMINLEMIGTLVNVTIGDTLSSLENLEVLNISGNKKIKDDDITPIVNRNKKLKILRCSNCTLLTNAFLDHFSKEFNHLLLLEINRTPLITDQKIEETKKKMEPNLRIIRATNIVWQKKNYGLTVPYQRDTYEKPTIKGAKKPAANKKGDDKSPEAQLIKLREEMRPKMIGEYFNPTDKAKKGKKKKK